MSDETTQTVDQSIDQIDPQPVPLRDRVVMATRDPDGNPREHNVEFVGDPDEVEQAARVQLTQQAVARVDEGINQARVAAETVERVEDPVVANIREVQDAEIAKAEKQAASEVKKLHPDA